MEGCVDDVTHPNFGPNASFWETPVGQSIASFGTHAFSSDMEEERRQYRSAIICTKEMDKQIDNILGPSLPRSTFVPGGYHSLTESMRPIEPIIDRPLTPRNPVQISTPLTSYVMSVPNPPRSFASGAQPSIPVSSVPLNARGKPPA